VVVVVRYMALRQPERAVQAVAATAHTMTPTLIPALLTQAVAVVAAARQSQPLMLLEARAVPVS
jgi:hypothetical protein